MVEKTTASTKGPDQSVSQSVSQSEQQRLALQTRISEVIGGSNPIFAEVLSHFPKDATSFIKIQEWAFQNDHDSTKKKALRLGYTDEDHINRNLSGREIDGNDHFTGRPILDTIKEIRILRGDPELPISQLGYAQNSETIFNLLETIDRKTKGEHLSEYNHMIDKTLEVMGVTPEEIRLIEDYYEATVIQDRQTREAERWEKLAQKLRDEGQAAVQNAIAMIESKYPRPK